jgi:TolB protein
LLFYEASIEEVGNIVTVRRFRGTSHIASLNLQTNERRTLTAGKGEKWSPQWLPQNRIAYCSGGPEGGLEYLTTNGEKSAGTRGEFRNPRWSPDGKRMIFHRDTDPNWPPFQPFASRDAQFKLMRTGVYPAASPDGNKLISNSEPGAIHHNKILIMNTDGSQRSVLLQDAEKSIVAPVWSPQGDKIAFGFGRFFQVFNGKVIGDVAVINSDGTGLQILTDGTGNNGFPSWSPDGKKIVFRSSGGASEGLFILDLATRAITPLLTNPQKDNFPAWSPRGDRIAFTRKRDGNYDIYTVKPDGSDLQRLTTTPGNDAHCVWSPDDEWLAFSSERQGFKDESALWPYNAQSYGDLYVMRTDGSDVRQLTDDQFEKATPGWIPKRKR